MYSLFLQTINNYLLLLLLSLLQEATLNHILANPNVVMTQIDSYSDLPSDLKQEVRLILSGTQQEIRYT